MAEFEVSYPLNPVSSKEQINCKHQSPSIHNDNQAETDQLNFIQSDEFNKQIKLSKPHRLGLFYDKFLEAFTFRTAFYREATYPFFGIYLNMPGHSYTTIYSIFQMFWSLKFFFGFLSDVQPIFGKARVYYMAIGWSIAAVAFTVSLFVPYPASYYAVSDCKLNTSHIQNEQAPDSGFIYALAIGLAAMGVAMVDCCSDALSVDYTKRESFKKRGWTIVGTLCCNNAGAAVLYLMVGFGLNSPAYNGTFCDLPLTYQHVLMAYLATCVLGIINSLFFTYDIPLDREMIEASVRSKMTAFWNLMQDRMFQRCAVLFLLSPALRLQSSGAVKIRKNWAQVQPLEGSVVAALCSLLGAVIIVMYQKLRKDVFRSWVYSYIISKLIFLSLTLLVDALTVFDVVRNQYFFFLIDVADSVHISFGACILMQLAAEIPTQGLEALTFSMFMSNWTVMSIVGRMTSNLISAPFNVIDDERYFRDSSDDRFNVFASVFAIYLLNIVCLAAIMFLCPTEKHHVQRLKKELGKSKLQAKIYFTCFVLMYLFSFVYLVLMMNRNFQCWVILGGNGC